MRTDQLLEQFTSAGLGPIATAIQAEPGVHVELDATGAEAARVLLRWVDAIQVFDAIAGRWTAADSAVRLIVRGLYPGNPRFPVFVVGQFDDPKHITLIDAQIARQDIPGLLEQLRSG